MSAALSSLLSSGLAASVWRGVDLGHAGAPVLRSGWERLDAELPGGGWPCGSLTELLVPRGALLEWRLLGTALRAALQSGGRLVLVGPPAVPYLPGLQEQGLDPAQLVWVRSRDAGQSLWAAEQVLRAGGAAAVLVWLPASRAEALRRLHAHAQEGRAPVFALRPEQAHVEASPAPLRVQARPGEPWELRVRLLKRRGPAHEQELRLASRPGALAQAILETPGQEQGDVVGRIAGLRLA
ncbi:translesion DNA synthesis-associated protein ImuA [Thiomonas sp. FB-6]|uniref:translesion DNA synthesis-associated protein ImuA n=1 Tax=Thiomonas sp. FB-6 TaxID=1158291 RepID=UPI00037F37BC|nr:translesion DNA synthesis-associated protein ImuA [Thiomonas sp. FB-6]